MKILIPIISYGRSGGFKVLSNLANYWVKNGHDVTVVMPSTEVDFYYPLNCTVIKVNCLGNITEKKAKYSVLQKIICLSMFLLKRSKFFDSIIANHNLTAYPVALFSRANNYYYIQAYEPEFSNEIKGQPIKKNITKILAWFTYFLPLKKIVNADIYKNYKNIKANHVIYPGINIDTFYPKNRVLKIASDKFYIGCIGRTEVWKGSDDAAEAIRILHQKGYDIEFLVAFNSVNYAKHSLVKPDGESNLADYYRSLDILITPGHIQLDAIHYPVIEALITKTPLVTTGYFPASDKNATIIKVKSPIDIAEKIEYLMKNYSIAIEKSIVDCEKISKEFDWNTVSNKFIMIIEKYNKNK